MDEVARKRYNSPAGTPPSRFAHARFSTYRAETPSQAAALAEAQQFAQDLRARQGLGQRVRRWLGQQPDWKGLYLVGPVGTGKTHLLAALYHDLHPDVPCAFYHASVLFRSADHPKRFALDLAERFDVLCLDEVELDDPANEARLVQILRMLDRLGVTLLATSNVEPESFLSAQFGDRFQRFLREEFRERYKVLLVRGDDYRRRQAKGGQAWIGPAEVAQAHLQRAFEDDARRKRWLGFDELMTAATETEHTRLMDTLLGAESLYLDGIAVDGTDTALRLLRLVDDLYLAPEPPALYFSAEAPPEAWFNAEEQRGVAKAIADKFSRTVSRLHALCAVERVSALGGNQGSEIA